MTGRMAHIGGSRPGLEHRYRYLIFKSALQGIPGGNRNPSSRLRLTTKRGANFD